MSSLYDIKQEILNCIDLETGEIIDTEKFDALQLEQNDKIEQIALWHKNLLADAVAYKAEKDAFNEKQKRAEAKAESLKKYLDTVLGGKKFSTVKVSITYRKSASVQVDLGKISKQYVVEKVDVSPDKNKIKEALKVGKVVGAELVESNNIQVK